MSRCVIKGLKIGDGAPVRLMGVINCSPESFYLGSYTPAEAVYTRACAMTEDGAEIIDLGARSTAPGAPPLSTKDESDRMDRALSELDGSGIRVSVDTIHASVLETCLRHEVAAINDISGLSNPEYARLVADFGLPAFLMASSLAPGDALTLQDTHRALSQVVARCLASGIPEYVLDPGIGLWRSERTPALDWEICRNFQDFTRYDRPLLAAISRKTFLGDVVEKPPEGRFFASLALSALLVERGADVVRTHDVAGTLDAVRVGEVLRRGQ
ncbi:MAG: dihydropteroate synthase [Methanolinea sp.]|nr:dihydropteroate synthase [Methanolinea sp.]